MILKIYLLKAFIYLFLLTGFSDLYAQIPAPAQSGPIALQGGTVVTVSGRTITGGTVVFDNGIITGVGVDPVIPGGTEIIDVSGKFVFPAMIHARSSLGLSEIGRVTETVDLDEHGIINPNVRAWVAFHAESEHIPLARTHGIAVTVATPTGGIISGLSAAMLTNGWDWEEMTLHAPAGMVINWPDMSDIEERDKELKKLSEAFLAARRYKIAKQTDTGQGALYHKTDVRWEAMIPVLEGEVPVHVHADEIRQIQAAINWAEQENVRMVLVGGRDAGYVLPQLKEKDIPVILTSVIGGPSRQWEGYDSSYSLPKKLYDAGIKYCIAGDFGAANAIRLAHHPSSAVAFGLPQEEAVRTITLYPARILGIEDRMGSIEKGKDASLIVADGNILELSTRVEQVYIQGMNIDMYDKHRRLFEKYQERYIQLD